MLTIKIVTKYMLQLSKHELNSPASYNEPGKKTHPL